MTNFQNREELYQGVLNPQTLGGWNCTAIIGQMGSGKTTLLDRLAGDRRVQFVKNPGQPITYNGLSSQIRRRVPVIAFDDADWLAQQDPHLTQDVTLDLTRKHYVVLALTPTGAHRIQDNQMKLPGGLITNNWNWVNLPPLSEDEIKQYLGENSSLAKEVYAKVGGLPFYVSSMKEGLSQGMDVNTAYVQLLGKDYFQQRWGELPEETKSLVSNLAERSTIPLQRELFLGDRYLLNDSGLVGMRDERAFDSDGPFLDWIRLIKR